MDRAQRVKSVKQSGSCSPSQRNLRLALESAFRQKTQRTNQKNQVVPSSGVGSKAGVLIISWFSEHSRSWFNTWSSDLVNAKS